MFAVVKISGQQYKVKAGQNLFVPHLGGKTGDKIAISDIVLLENEGNVSLTSEAKATVNVEIVNELVKGEKVTAFKMKRRKGFRKKHGHRTHYTQIKVTDIVGNDDVKIGSENDRAVENAAAPANENVTASADENAATPVDENVTASATGNGRLNGDAIVSEDENV